jgi:hypothetical protein
MDQALLALYHRHIAVACDRQMRLGDLLEREAQGKPWSYTISTARLAFGDALHFKALDLGTHAEPDNSMLWAWCNPHLKLTSANRAVGATVRKLGRDAGIAALTAKGQVSCDEILGKDLSPLAVQVLAAIVAGELGFDAYFMVPFAHGEAVALIRDKRLRVDVPSPAARIVTIFPQVLTAFAVLYHRAAFIAYATSYGLSVQEKPKTVRVFADGQEVLKATFDARNRIKELKGTWSEGPGGQ